LSPSGIRLALRHLTVLPLPWSDVERETAPAAALPWFPVAGLVIGTVVAVPLTLPLPALPRAALALALWSGITGALHEDAWMDTADAALAVVPRNRRLEILEDPHVGAHAVTALATVLLLRFSALTVAPSFAPIVAAVCGRWMMVLTLARFRPARADGLAAAFARDARALPATLIAGAILATLALLTTPVVAVAAIIAAVTGAMLAAWLDPRFGGLNGDGHGAAGFAAETAALLAFTPFA
jgi:adenosylcobinamide-GDP ribazoletransferase